jgi:hypothetical protein
MIRREGVKKLPCGSDHCRSRAELDISFSRLLKQGLTE